MPRKRRVAKMRTADLTHDQYFELWLGPPGDRSAFANDRERREAWARHGESLLADATPGTRPWGWFEYAAKRHPVYPETDADLLRRLGALTPEEERQLAYWDSLKTASERVR
jgi:hypothetical protein